MRGIAVTYCMLPVVSAFASVLILAQPMGLRAAEPATVPTTREALSRGQVAALVREVRKAESWVDEATTMHIVLTWTETRPAPMLANRKASYGELMPGVEVIPDRCAGLLPVERFRSEMAFGDQRVAYRRTSLDEGTFQHRVWDGTQLKEQAKASRVSEPRLFPLQLHAPEPQHIFYDLSSFRAGSHVLWLGRTIPLSERNLDEGLPEDFELASAGLYRGVEWVVAYGSSGAQGNHAVQEVAKMRTRKEMTMEQIETWQKRLPEEEAIAFGREVAQATFPLAQVVTEYWMGDYKEIMPGRFLPMTQGVVFFPGKELNYWREGRVEEVAVDEELPAELLRL